MVNKRTILVAFIVVLIFIVLVVSGAAVYHELEDVSFRDSVYFQVNNATTIGATEFSPKTTGGIWFQMFWSPILVIYFLGAFFYLDKQPL